MRVTPAFTVTGRSFCRWAGWCLTVVTLGLPVSGFAEDDWNQWRGPARDGTIQPGVQVAGWTGPPVIAWQTEVGTGYSSPVVSEGRVFLIARQNGMEHVVALDLKSGTLLWEDRYSAPFTPNRYATGHGQGPLATPLVTDERVVTVGVNGVISAYDVGSGSLQWRQFPSGVPSASTVRTRPSTANLFCGQSGSPLLEGDRVIVQAGDDGGGSVSALELGSGSEVWTWEGPGPGYASPVLAEIGGVRQLLILTKSTIVSLNARDGIQLWSLPFEDEWNENIVTPLVVGQRILFSGVRRGTFVVEAKRAGGDWTVTEIWRRPRISMYMSSPVYDGTNVFGFSTEDKGRFFCINPASGDVCWESEPRQGESASVAVGKDRLVLLTTEGKLVLADRTAEEFRPLREVDLKPAGPVFASPAIVSDGLVVRSGKSVTRWILVP